MEYNKETGKVEYDLFDWFNEMRNMAWDFPSALLALGYNVDEGLEDIPDPDYMRPYKDKEAWANWLIEKFPSLKDKKKEMLKEPDYDNHEIGFFDWDT